MLRSRDFAINRENVNVRPGKDALIKPAALKPSRPALGEVGNKIDHIQKARTTKPTLDVGQKKPLVKENVAKKTKAVLSSSVAIRSSPQKPQAKCEEVNKKCDKIIAYSTRQLDDVNEQPDKKDPLLVAEYVEDIYGYLRDLEIKYAVKPDFLENHKSTPRMRSILVNWLVDAHKDFAYLLETLHLAISLVDRYLQKDKTVDRNNLQLVGVSALWIAAKYEEMYVSSLKDYVYLTDNAFTERDVLRMEQKILVGVDWGVGRPLPIHFLKRYSKLASVQPKEYVLGKYLLELALLQSEMCHIRPSLLAAASICFAVAILNDFNNPSQVWSEDLVHKVGYSYKELKDIIVQLAQTLIQQETSKYRSVKQKYAEQKWYKISQHSKLNCNMVKMLATKATKKS